jgi:hypothetical protein
MRRAFVSHSTTDDSFVGEMESFLRAAGYDEVFNDVSAIHPDEQFWPKIEKGIADAETLVVVITAASNDSEWVKREVEFARGISKKIIPVLIEDCPVPEIFAGRDVIDFRPRTRAERRFEISRIVKYAPTELIGREDETRRLNEAWQRALRAEKCRVHVLTFVALGGEGKTSLVAKWAAELAHQGWPGCEAAFAWSFYEQGTREQVAASSDLFLKEALTFFGDDTDREFAGGSTGAYEKGQRLARIVGRRRSVLILDGLEPLQYSPAAPTPGQLRDQGIAALLKGLAATSQGLCVVTTRYSLPDLRAFWATNAPEVPLPRLSRAAGVHLLQSLGVNGSLLRSIPFDGEQVNEFEKLVEDVQGHALTLNLLGTYLRDAHAGDIRKRDLVKLEEADAEEQGGHAFRVMEAYERELELEGEKGQRALAVLRLLGLFDRPLTPDCLDALLQGPAIHGLTEALVGLIEAQRNVAFKRLENARLLTVNRDAFGSLVSLDAHPLLREYFARRLREQQSVAWRGAHRRLYEHLCATAPKWTRMKNLHKFVWLLKALGILKTVTRYTGHQPTLEDLQPLYQAIVHGCHAGIHGRTCSRVFRDRILRWGEYYSTATLGAYSSDLGALGCFYVEPWTHISDSVSKLNRRPMLGLTGYLLRSVGRLTEAIKPTELSLRYYAKERCFGFKNWGGAALSASFLSDLELVLGDVNKATKFAEDSVTYADLDRAPHLRFMARVIHADCLYHEGNLGKAESLFRQAERIRPKHLMRSVDPNLMMFCDFRIFEWLLAEMEKAAWRIQLGLHPENSRLEALAEVSQRATETLKAAEDNNLHLDAAFDHLILGRSRLYEAVVTSLPLLSDSGLRESVESAMTQLRRYGTHDHLPRAFLTRAWLRFLAEARSGPESAQADLDEAWEIAERGPMKLHMADIHLHRARLFFREAQYPWDSPEADLAAAEKLINECGYHRRDEELADAKAAILSK